MKRITARMVAGGARPEDGALLKSVADQIAGRTICAFGEACAWPTQSFVQKFGEEFESYAADKKSPAAPPETIHEMIAPTKPTSSPSTWTDARSPSRRGPT